MNRHPSEVFVKNQLAEVHEHRGVSIAPPPAPRYGKVATLATQGANATGLALARSEDGRTDIFKRAFREIEPHAGERRVCAAI